MGGVVTVVQLWWHIPAGGADKNAVVFQKDTEQVLAILKGHTKKVTAVVYHPKEVRAPTKALWFGGLWLYLSAQDIGITSSPDTTVKIWGVESASCRQTIRVSFFLWLKCV